MHAHFPEVKIFGVNTAEVSFATRILLDYRFQGSDRLCLCNLDRKNTLWIVAEDPAVEIKHLWDITCSRYRRSRIIGIKERMCNTLDRLRSVRARRLSIERLCIWSYLIGNRLLHGFVPPLLLFVIVPNSTKYWSHRSCLPPGEIAHWSIWHHQKQSLMNHMLQHMLRHLTAGQQLSEEATSTTLCWIFDHL